MLERDGFPPGVPCWVDTSQPDPEAAAAFYGGLFGWGFEDRMPADAAGQYLVAQLRGRDVAAVGSQPDGPPSPVVWNTYIWVDDADETGAAVTRAGGSVLTAPFDVLEAGRMAVFADPAGAVFCVWQPSRHRGAQLVNEPGTWNWSNLNTRDPEGAKAFYGAVFGWETIDLGPGSTMWRLPGYSEFLEAYDPDLRSRHSESGVPEGFSDAIAWMAVMTDEQFPTDTQPHWDVTFAVDDTDAIADKAAELDGTVLAPPFDVDVVRIAVLRDPQGAVFTVSKYDPGLKASD